MPRNDKEGENTMKKNTGIRIEATKEVGSTGDIGYKVTSVAALSDNQLPPLYLQSNRPVVWQRATGNRELLIKPEGNKTYTTYLSKSFYTTEEMQEKLALIIKAGQHLTDVNRELAKNRKTWQGKVVFVDGKIESEEFVAVLKPSKTSVKLGESVLDRIPRLWAEGKLYYCNAKGHIKPLKPAE